VDGLGFTWSLHLVCACLSWTFAAPGVLILIGPAVCCCLDQSQREPVKVALGKG
jgi:hypothetical protein